MIKLFSFNKNKLKEISPEDIGQDKKTSYWIDLTCSNVEEIKIIRIIIFKYKPVYPLRRFFIGFLFIQL